MHLVLGVGIDGPNDEGIILIKEKGKVKMLENKILESEASLKFDTVSCCISQFIFRGFLLKLIIRQIKQNL